MDWKEARDKILSDPEVQGHYEQLKPKYQVIKQLIEQRKRLNITQKELAERLGTTQSVIARLESGKGNITLQTLERMSEVLGCILNIKLEPISSEGKKPTLMIDRFPINQQ